MCISSKFKCQLSFNWPLNLSKVYATQSSPVRNVLAFITSLYIVLSMIHLKHACYVLLFESESVALQVTTDEHPFIPTIVSSSFYIIFYCTAYSSYIFTICFEIVPNI